MRSGYFVCYTLSGTPREKLDTRFEGNSVLRCRRERREQRRNKEHEDAIFAAPINHDEYEEEQEEGNGTTTDSSTKVDDSAMAFFKQCYNQRQFRRRFPFFCECVTFKIIIYVFFIQCYCNYYSIFSKENLDKSDWTDVSVSCSFS